jgi:hypothetical protein
MSSFLVARIAQNHAIGSQGVQVTFLSGVTGHRARQRLTVGLDNSISRKGAKPQKRDAKNRKSGLVVVTNAKDHRYAVTRRDRA